METGRFLFDRRACTIQLQLEGSLKRSVLKPSPPQGWRREVDVECRWPTAMEALLRICASAPRYLPATRFSTHELRLTSFRPSLRRSSDRERLLASRGPGRAVYHRLEY